VCRDFVSLEGDRPPCEGRGAGKAADLFGCRATIGEATTGEPTSGYPFVINETL